MEALKKFLDKYLPTLDYRESEGRIVVKNDIDLSARDISELPEDIGDLKCENLYLYDNKIVELPESIGDIKCDILFLYRNKIEVLPEGFSRLVCKRIFLEGNNISELPKNFGDLTCEDLYLNRNPLKDGLRYFKDWSDSIGLYLNKTPLSKDNGSCVGDYRKEIDLEWELWNNKDLSGAKDCYDSGLFDFKVDL